MIRLMLQKEAWALIKTEALFLGIELPQPNPELTRSCVIASIGEFVRLTFTDTSPWVFRGQGLVFLEKALSELCGKNQDVELRYGLGNTTSNLHSGIFALPSDEST